MCAVYVMSGLGPGQSVDFKWKCFSCQIFKLDSSFVEKIKEFAYIKYCIFAEMIVNKNTFH